MSNPPYAILILILGSLTALSPIAIDMYLPAFPEIAKNFQVPTTDVALSLSTYFFGLAIGQLIYGPLLDRFGRKPPLYAGLFVFALASIACYFTTSIDTFIALRLLQALGGCAANVAAMSMVRDLYSVKEGAKVFSLLMLVLGVSPLLAPTIGTYIALTWNWQIIFLILALLSLLLIVCSYWFLPVTHKADKDVTLRLKPIAVNFLRILQEPQFYTYTLAGAVAFSGLFVYVSGSPIIFLDIFKLNKESYGWVFAGLSLGFIGASQLNIYFLKQNSNERILHAAMLLQMTTGCIFALLAWFQILNLYITLLLLFMFLGCVGLINPNATSLALAPFSKNIGSASAMMGFLQMGIGALASTFVGLSDSVSIVPTAIILCVSSVLANAVLFWGRKRIRYKHQASNSDVGIGHI